jgi:hypothetical protein
MDKAGMIACKRGRDARGQHSQGKGRTKPHLILSSDQ